MTHYLPGSLEALARASMTLASEVLAVSTRSPESVSQEVLTISDLADLLRVPESAVRQLVARGEIPGRLIGGDWRFLKSTILTWLSGVDCRHRVRTAGGWEEDASFPKEEWRSAAATELWGDAASKEAEDFIRQMHDSRRASAEDPSQKEDGK